MRAIGPELVIEAESYKTLINGLFGMPVVRYAVVTDDFGRRLAGGMKQGVESTTPAEIEKRLETQAVLILKMAEGYIGYDGSLIWASIRWEKIVALFFLLGEGKGALTVTLQGYSSFESVTEVHRIVEHWKSDK